MNSAIDITEPLASVMLSCEVRCVVGCCGLDAFDIHPQWIRAWMEDNGREALDLARQQIDELIISLSDLPGSLYVPLFAEWVTSAEWIQMLMEWRTAIENAPETPLPVRSLPTETPLQRFRDTVGKAATLGGSVLLGVIAIILVIALLNGLLGRW